MTIEAMKKKAKQIRCDAIRMIGDAGSGHPGGSLSATDIMVALYYSKMKLSDDPNDEARDRFVLSKGHANPSYYAILADKGYFPKAELKTLRRLHSILQGHPDCNKCPGVDCSTGSLGQGISVAVGMALGFHLAKRPNRVYVLTGDGELQEGLAWEAFMAASHYRLDNLTVIVDNNHLQLDGSVDEVMSLGDLAAKFRAFGFAVREADGHDYEALLSALDYLEDGKPLALICNTVKGKGVSFMENALGWHGKAPSGDELEKALKELEDN